MANSVREVTWEFVPLGDGKGIWVLRTKEPNRTERREGKWNP